jgi:hypothetical protein
MGSFLFFSPFSLPGRFLTLRPSTTRHTTIEAPKPTTGVCHVKDAPLAVSLQHLAYCRRLSLSPVLPSLLSLHFLACVPRIRDYFSEPHCSHREEHTSPSLNKPPETSALQASRPAICHGFTLPADDRELSLQKLTCSSPPYEIMVTDDGRVHHRTDSLHPHLSRLSHGYWVAGGSVCHPEFITSGRLQVKRRCPKPIATCVGGRGRSPERNTCVRSLFPLSRSFGSCSLL